MHFHLLVIPLLTYTLSHHSTTTRREHYFISPLLLPRVFDCLPPILKNYVVFYSLWLKLKHLLMVQYLCISTDGSLEMSKILFSSHKKIQHPHSRLWPPSRERPESICVCVRPPPLYSMHHSGSALLHHQLSIVHKTSCNVFLYFYF
jgi:hypothetical protein